MDPRDVLSVQDARTIVEERQLKHVKIGVFDVDGIMRGKYMSLDKFFTALDSGFGLCDVVLGWDCYDQLYDNVEYTGWHTGYPDVPIRILPETCRDIPFEGDMLLFLGEFCGGAEAICPRNLLGRVVERSRDMGYDPLAAFEYEFFVFDETPQSVNEKGFRDLRPISPEYFGYSNLRNSADSEFFHQLLDTSEAMDFPIESLHTETGPGVIEAALTYDGAQNAADKAALFKTFSKVIAQRNGRMVTFMAKWSPNWPGQSGHIHMSLRDLETGRPAFHDPEKEHGMSDTQRHFLGGQQALMPELTAMEAQTVNSYTRLIPGFWAPTEASWGVDNRTCALRVILGSEKSQRIEYRLTSADSNPYLALAAALASGLWGIENQVEPEEQVTGNAYQASLPPGLSLPRTLMEAAGRLRESKVALDYFGRDFVEHYAATREWEEREFRKHITDWELKRYFEII
ncbi:MAG: glutamine synthetase [Theionarchaea archaeon]|nr:glutamine synthetase [Theionarchaea archaeon]